MIGPEPDVAVVGGGLAGGLLALALAENGLAVQLVDSGDAQPAATSLSYGAMASWALPRTPLGQVLRQAPNHWHRLQQRYGDLGWRSTWFRPMGAGAPLGGRLPLPCSRVLVWRFRHQLPQVLRRLGVVQTGAVVRRLDPPERRDARWSLPITPVADGAGQGEVIRPRQVVLAAGAGCRSLWPQLPGQLRLSWAGVLALQQQSLGWPWARFGAVGLRLPRRFQRLELEARAPQLAAPEWQVDPGLLPWEEGWLAGQITLVRPGLDLGEPPSASDQEQHLRQALAGEVPALEHWPGRLRQVPVSFCTGGLPLVGPLAEAPGLWLFSGFSGAFTAVPSLAPLLARWIAASSEQVPAEAGQLAALGLVPMSGLGCMT